MKLIIFQKGRRRRRRDGTIFLWGSHLGIHLRRDYVTDYYLLLFTWCLYWLVYWWNTGPFCDDCHWNDSLNRVVYFFFFLCGGRCLVIKVFKGCVFFSRLIYLIWEKDFFCMNYIFEYDFFFTRNFRAYWLFLVDVNHFWLSGWVVFGVPVVWYFKTTVGPKHIPRRMLWWSVILITLIEHFLRYFEYTQCVENLKLYKNDLTILELFHLWVQIRASFAWKSSK